MHKYMISLKVIWLIVNKIFLFETMINNFNFKL